MDSDPDWTSEASDISAAAPTPGSTLVVAPHLHTCDSEACLDLLTPVDPTDEAILAVTATEDASTKLSRWHQSVNDAPAEMTVVDIDVTMRSASTGSEPSDRSSLPHANVETVADPTDTAAIKRTVISQLTAWETSDLQPVICFQPLTTLLEYLDRDELLQFLRVLLGRIVETEAVAHFHLDPRGVDETLLTTLIPLFDATLHVEADSDGVRVTDRTDRDRRVTQSLALLDKATESFFILDSQRRITYYSGASTSELINDQYRLFGTQADKYIHPDDRETAIADFDAILANAESIVTTEFRVQPPDSTASDWRWYEARMRNCLEEDPINGVVVSVRDVTTRKQQALRLKRQRDRLDEFTSVISHDLRNPLNVASGQLELAQDTVDNQHLEHASDALDRIDQMIDDLLTLAKQGDLIDDRRRVSLVTVVEQSLKTVDTADATVEVVADQTVVADKNRLVQLFENLLRNAVEHAGDDVSITIGACEDADGFYLEDNGPGFQSAAETDVFDKGVSTTPGNSGLGLAIVRRIAHAHGWNVTATSSASGGARFVFTGLSESVTHE